MGVGGDGRENLAIVLVTWGSIKILGLSTCELKW